MGREKELASLHLLEYWAYRAFPHTAPGAGGPEFGCSLELAWDEEDQITQKVIDVSCKCV